MDEPTNTNDSTLKQNPCARSFPLLRRLTITSLAVMILTAALLILLYRQDQIEQYEKQTAQDNNARAALLIRILEKDIYTLLASPPVLKPQSLSANPHVAEFRKKLEKLVSSDVLKVKIFDHTGRARYSSDPNEIGGGSKSPAMLTEALQGQVKHRIEFRERFTGRMGEMTNVHVALIYVPIIKAEQEIGVFELYADTSNVFERLHSNSIRIAEIVFGIFASLFAILFFAVYRTERAILKWQKTVASSESALKESQLIAGLGTYVIHLRTGQIETSDIIDHLLGIDQTYEHTVAGWMALVHPDDREMLRTYFEEGIAEGKDLDMEYRFIRQDDHAVRWAHGLGKHKFDADGNSIKIHGTLQDITEQKEYSLRAENAELRYKALLHSAADALFVIDPKGNFVEVNQQAVDHSGYCKEELLQMNVADISAEFDPAIEIPKWREIKLGQPYHIFSTHRRKDGSICPVEIHITALLIDGQKLMMALVSDITERRQAEAAMKLNRTIIDRSSDGFYRHDMDGFLNDVNPAYADMIGYTHDELIGMHVSQLSVTAGTREQVQKRIEIVRASGAEKFKTRHRRKDGRFIDFAASLIYLKESNSIFAFLRDITEQERAEEELRIAAVAFETNEAIVITDADSNIIRVNQAFTEITGYGADEVGGKNPRIMSSGKHDRAFYIEMWQQLLHTGSWSGEIWDRRKDGDIYPKWMNITAVKNRENITTHYVAIFSDITERKRIEEEIHNLAFYDALTKLPNRRLFLDRFQAALVASARRNEFGAILFIDLDRFKVLNDTHGHEYGDMLLIEVGKRIKSCVREMDTVARFGGDEFVVLIESVSKDQDDAIHKVSLVAEKVRQSLSEAYALKDHQHHCSPSIGVSMFYGNGVTPEALLEQADMAMYQVKGSGRNGVSFFDPVMQENLTMRETMENDLYHAIPLNQLHLHYQIQVDEKNRPTGCEAFLRWQHPEHGIVMPRQFLPIAEDGELITQIGHWVLQTACHQLAVWAGNDATRDLALTVNISAKHFAQVGFVDEVAGILKTHQVDPSKLKLELSEKIVLTDTNIAMNKIDALRVLGVKLSMDNFSTMYSSLSYLKQLSQDQLKIHQEFVQGIASGGNEEQLVRTVVNLARSLDLNIFAEGVETEEQLDFLRSQNCNSYQGYLFGKPVAIEEFETLLSKLQKS
ncbi:PAS domain S-box protein [Sideroxydans sp.]